MIRTFIAVELPDEVKRDLDALIAGFRRHQVRVSWVRAENLHVTMKFLGEIEEETLPPLYENMSREAGILSPFLMSLDGLGAFPNLHRPRVFWVGVNRGREELVKLFESVERACAASGFSREKRGLSAHVTFGRVREPRGVQALTQDVQNAKFSSSDFMTTSVVIMKSDLTPRGPIYTPLKRFELGK